MKEKFESFKNYKDNKNTITILYPGSFKPLTGAHIDIIKRYLNTPNVKKVILFISPGKRDEIDSEIAYEIAKHILSDFPVDIILDKKSYSPILACYRWIEKNEREPGKYALASSTKENDYKRVKEFSDNYSSNKFGKNLPKGIEVIELPINVDPLTYPNGEPISATQARKDFKEGNYEKFKESFPELPDEKIKYIWDQLLKSKKISSNKELEETGEGNITGREDIYPSEKYITLKNVY